MNKLPAVDEIADVLWHLGWRAFGDAQHEAVKSWWLEVLAAIEMQASHSAAADVVPVAYKLGSWFEARTLDELQAFYMARLPAIREAARNHGYAIGLHGSTRRDFDLIAMQWGTNVSDKDTLAHAIAMAACGITRSCAYDWEQKPNGRVATSMPVCWTDHKNPEFEGMISLGHIDLSIVETSTAPASEDGQFMTAEKLANLRARIIAETVEKCSNATTPAATTPAASESIASNEFLGKLLAWINVRHDRTRDEAAYDAIIAHINAHTAAHVAQVVSKEKS